MSAVVIVWICIVLNIFLSIALSVMHHKTEKVFNDLKSSFNRAETLRVDLEKAITSQRSVKRTYDAVLGSLNNLIKNKEI